jgi:uncharacterized protein YcfJ
MGIHPSSPAAVLLHLFGGFAGTWRRDSYPNRKGEEMSEQAVEQQDAAKNDVDERVSAEPKQEQTSNDRGSSLTTWTTVGAVVGATAGGVVGAAIGATLARRPEFLEQAREAINRDGGRVAKAAMTAAGGVVAGKSVQGLAQGADNGERTKLMKQAAREAAAAAAGATRDAIVSIRSKGSDAS